MNGRPRPISPEVARRATYLPACPCGPFPMLVTDRAERCYVHCPSCGAQTHRCDSPKVAERQWRVLVCTAEAS